MNLDISHEFDSCVILSYYSGDNLKKKSTMGFHCDNTYNRRGKYMECSNSQIENTPIVIVSFGETRVLNFERLYSNKSSKGKHEWLKDESFHKSMVMDENNIVIINSSDEKPHKLLHSDKTCKYRHGNVCVQGENKMSFSLVFRVVQKYANYNVYNDTMLPDFKNNTVREKNYNRHVILSIILLNNKNTTSC